MVNQTVDKAQRKRDYTAADIANNTDNIAWQIAVLKYVDKSFDIDGTLADYAQESGINEKIAQEQAGAESVINDTDSVIDDVDSVVEGEQSEGETKYSLNKDAKTELHKALYDKNYKGEVLLRDNTPSIMLGHNGVKNLPMTMNTSHIRENVFSEKEAKSLGLRIDGHTHYHELGEDFFLKIIDGLDNVTEAYRGTKNATDASRRENYFLLISTFKDKNGNTINVPVYIDEHALYNRVFIDTNKISTVFGRENLREYINKQVRDKNLVKIKRSTQSSESNALIAEDYRKNASKDSIHQNEPKVNPESEKNIDKADLADKAAKTAQEGEKKSERAVEGEKTETSAEDKKSAKVTEKSSEGKNKSTESKKAETKISEKEALTDEQRREKARERAEKLLKWNEEQKPTAKELNEAREYVKGFDNLDINRRMAIIRTIRSAEGKVDKKMLKGVANVMAAIPKADVEIRFAEGLAGDKGGLYTHVGNKTLLVIDRGTDFKNTIQGTIAHELVHYLENRAGYKQFAEYVMKRVKPEMKAEITKRYTEHYKAIFAAEARASGVAEADIEKAVAERMATDKFKALIDSEIVAKYVGKALNNEKLLKKYADKDKKLIARVGEWLGRTVTSLKKKDVDKEAVKVAEDMAFRVTVLLQSETVGESKGTKTKYSLRVKHTNGTETIANPYETTREQTLEYMRMARKGQLENYTYFPVSSYTSKTIIDTLKNADINIENRPLAMQADKARQSQIDAKPLYKNGFTIRYHAMSSEKILEVIDNLDEATAIIHQRNRITTKEIDGEEQIVDLPDNFAVFVTLEDGKEYVAIIEFDAKIKSDYIIEDGNGDKYHTTVTVFEPDVERDGEPFDYIEYLLLRGDNEELDIIKENSESEAAIRQTEATAPKKEFSNSSIHQNEPVVNSSEEKNITKSDLSDTKADLSDNPKKAGKDGTELNEQGEVKDEFFEAAVLRSLENRQEAAETDERRREQRLLIHCCGVPRSESRALWVHFNLRSFTFWNDTAEFTIPSASYAKSPATRQDTARRSRDFSQDTSVDSESLAI